MKSAVEKQAHDAYNSTFIANARGAVVKDYMLPEVRALEDRNDRESILEAMAIRKVSEHGISRDRDKL